MDEQQAELLQLSQRLLDSIEQGDWETYEALCDPSLSCFEPEARGHLVEGMEFHRFYFERPIPSASTTICAPHVRMLGDNAAVVSYVRLLQLVDHQGAPQTRRFEETRIWQRQPSGWRHVHFHRSCNE